MAMRNCQREGKRLASVDTYEEDEAIQDYIKDNGKEIMKREY